MANTYSCYSKTEVTFSWKAKNSSLFYPLIVRFMALISSLTFFLFWVIISSISISYWILSASLFELGLTAITPFLMELARFLSLFSNASFGTSFYFASYFIYFGISFGGSRGCGCGCSYFLGCRLELFGGILFCEFFCSNVFWTCPCPLATPNKFLLLFSYFLMIFALSIFLMSWTCSLLISELLLP